jgi:hypothetical protein
MNSRRKGFLLIAVGVAVVIGTAGLVTAELVLHAATPSPGAPVYNGTTYYHTAVSVPSNATQGSPMRVTFHSAAFVLWWPYIPPGTISTGVYGVSLTVSEPSGPVDSATSDCAACGQFSATWFSPDHEVGIAYTAAPGDLGNLTLLVAT